MPKIYDVLIIGSGPAGLTAAIYTSRAALKLLVLAGVNFGGQLMSTTEVDNYPGFPDGIMGPKLMQRMIKQAERFGAELVYKNATKVDLTSNPKIVWSGEEEYLAKAVIISTGADPKLLGLKSEKQYMGKGVSVCATCDAAFFKGKVVAVVGGGDTAAEEATFLTKFASKVYLVVRKNQMRASKAMQKKVKTNTKIETLWNTEVSEIIGNENVVTEIEIRNNTDGTNSNLPMDGIFIAIGHKPNSIFLDSALETDKSGYIKTDRHVKTSIDGVFVAGDVEDNKYKQAITAASFGCMAAMETEKWLASQ